MEERVMQGKTVEEAIELGLKVLDVDREEAEVEILSRGRPGFLGIGSEPARVRVRKLGPSQGSATTVLEVVKRVLAGTGAETMATIRSAYDPDTGGPIIDITGDDSGLLIGRRGETLRALQFLVNLIAKKTLNDDTFRVILDVERYRERRDNSLKEMALRVADRVVANGRAISLEPMPAAERRIIHITLSDHPQVSTQSSGYGDSRNVTITPKKS